jgi:hypothetical protein
MGAPAEAVAKEMRTMGLTKLSEWENVRTLAPMGRKDGPIKVNMASRDKLYKVLSS